MALDFSKYLSVKTEELEGSPSLPLGHFHARIISWKTQLAPFKDEDGHDVPIVRLNFRITAASDDVDLDGYDTEKFPISGQMANRDYKLNVPNEMKALRRVAEEGCGLNIKGQDLEDTLNDLKGQDVLIHNTPRAGKGEREGEFFTNIDKVLSANPAE